MKPDVESAGAVTPVELPMARLKRATEALHREVEAGVNILSPEATQADVFAHLVALHGFHAPLEARLQEFEPVLPLQLSERRRARLLEDDLAALGLTPGPQCEDLPALPSVEAALGCLYVIEGSTLGGQLIVRRLEGRHGLSATRGLTFLAGYGERTGTMWKALAAAINGALATEAQVQEAAEGARATFAALARWLRSSAAR